MLGRSTGLPSLITLHILSSGLPVLDVIVAFSNVLSPASENSGDALVALLCVCFIAADIMSHHPGLSHHPRCKRKPSNRYRPRSCPNADASSRSTGIFLNAFVTCMIWVRIHAQSSNVTLNLKIVCNASCITPASAHDRISSRCVVIFTDSLPCPSL